MSLGELPKGVYFDISDAITRAKCLKAAFSGYFQEDSSSREFFDLVRQVRKCLPAGLSDQVIVDSISHLKGGLVTDNEVGETAWRIAGNIPLLKQGVPVCSTISMTHSGWGVVQVKSCRPFLLNPSSRHTRNRGCIYTLFVLTGPAAGKTIEKFLGLKYLKGISKALGFSAPYKKTPFKDERELFWMRFAGWFSPELARDNKPSFSEVVVSSAMKNWNKNLIKLRKRIGFNCPISQPEAKLPCYNCWMGKDRCSAATHGETYVVDVCGYCGSDSLFSPSSSSDKCLNCVRYEDTTGREMSRKEVL
jgi:hypothetical protein